MILLAISGVLALVKPPRRRYLMLVAPVVATVMPLIYGVALSRWDPSWRYFQSQIKLVPTAPWWALLASFGPLAIFAALGVRRPRADSDWMLLLWIPACAAVYFLVPQFPPHALSGLTLPLAVLAVRGWQRVRLSRRLAASVALVAILAVTVPAIVYHGQATRDALSNTFVGALAIPYLRLTTDQASALAYIDRQPRPGGVLAPRSLSMSVPAFTGRQAYAGHPNWQPHSNVSRTFAFFDAGLNDPGGVKRRAILEQTKVAFVLADCGVAPTLAADIAPIARPVKRFGCVTVYETS